MKIYCQECGQPTEYVSKKPKFCSECTHPFQPEFAQAAKVNKVQKPTQAKNEEEEEGEIPEDPDGEVFVPKLKKLDISIQDFKRGKVSVAELQSNNPVDTFVRDIPKKINRKAILEDFAREAGAIKPHTRTHKNKQSDE